jgi:CMP-N,N'-diacetyllegionaminic acid synthase
MLENKRILALIPARGKSSFKRKNMQLIDGVSLVGHAINCAINLEYHASIDETIVSTDNDEIRSEARSYKVNTIDQPTGPNGEALGDLVVLTDALTKRPDFDYVVMLQPTSPNRNIYWVWEAILHLHKNEYDAVWTISQTSGKDHPLKQLRICDGIINYYDDRGSKIIERQQLPALYQRNGVAYVFTRECILEQKTILGKKTGYLIIHEPVANIDTPTDLEWARFLYDHKRRG